MTSTANGAAHFGCAGGAASAVAWARTVTESSPKSFANTPGTALRAVTWIWSLATSFEEKVTSEPVTPPPLRFGVGHGEGRRLAGALRQGGRAGESRGIGVVLHLAMRPVPRADVDNGSGHPEDDRHEHKRQNHCLAALALDLDSHSTRSVVVLERRPDLEMIPNRLMEYGYVALTVTSSPGCHVEVQVADRSDALRFVADARTADVHAL